MSVSIHMATTGIERARRALDRLSYFDSRDLLDTVGALVEGQVRTRIEDQEGPPDGGRWEPLSSRYADSKREISDGGFLELRGHLRDSLTHNVIASEALEVGSDRPYAARQQFGYKDITPAREYLGLSDENEKDLDDAIEKWFAEVIGV